MEKRIRSGTLGELDAMSRSEFRLLNPCKRYQMLSLAMKYKPYQEENLDQRDKSKMEKRADFYLYCMRYSFFNNYSQALKDAIFGTHAMVQPFPCIFTDAETRNLLVLSGSVKYDGRTVQATALIDPEWGWGFATHSIKYIHVAPKMSCSSGEHILLASTSFTEYHTNLAALLSGAYGHQAAEEPDARIFQMDPNLSEFMENNVSIRGGYVSLEKTVGAHGSSDTFGAGDDTKVGAALNEFFSSNLQKISDICKENGWTDLMQRLGLE